MVCGIHRKSSGGANIDSGEIVNGVIVLGIAEAAREDRTGIAGVFASFARAHRLDPANGGFAGLGRGLLFGFRRRHVAIAKPLEDEIPVGIILHDRLHRFILAQIKIGLGLLLVMTLDAVAFDQRPHFTVEALLQFLLAEFRGGTMSRPQEQREKKRKLNSPRPEERGFQLKTGDRHAGAWVEEGAESGNHIGFPLINR